MIATYNFRSLMPKIQCLKNDLIERSVSLGFLQETWEDTENRSHQFEIEKLMEIDGFQYISAPRPKNYHGRSYGGAAIVVNKRNYSCEKLNILVPYNLEIVWSLVKPKKQLAKFKNIISCSFYSHPNRKKNTKMADHIVTTLHMLLSKYPNSAIIQMDISPILNCGLKLRQVVDKNTRKGKILDVLICIIPLLSPHLSRLMTPVQDNPVTTVCLSVFLTLTGTNHLSVIIGLSDTDLCLSLVYRGLVSG